MAWAKRGFWLLGVFLAAALIFAVQPREPPVKKAPPPSMRLLTQSQYAQTLTAIFGAQLAPNVRLAPMPRSDGLLAVGARSAWMTVGALEPLEESAQSIAAQVMSPEHRDNLLPCLPAPIAGRDDGCGTLALRSIGRLLFRRPLTAPELGRLTALAGDAAVRTHDFYAGLGVALEFMLVSPDFLYIQENVEADPDRSGHWRLDGYSKASRLSFFLWNAAPDDELLLAAEQGRLHTRAGLGSEIDRLLASPRVRQGVRALFDDMLVTEAFDIFAKDPVIFPAFTSRVVGQAREQLLRTVVNHVVQRDADYRDLFVTRSTEMTRELAAVYGVPVDAGPDEWVPYEFTPEQHRDGILTQVGFLARYAHPGRTSPTNRGRGLRETLLCQRVPDPPPNVDFTLFEDPHRKMRTARERLAAHATNPVCAGCHRLTDPIGLVLEHYDGAGQYRVTENGNPIDTTGAVGSRPVEDAASLGAALREDPAVPTCLVRRLYSYGVGRKLTADDRPLLEYLEKRFRANDYRVLALMRTVAASEAFVAVQPDSPRHLTALESRHADQAP